MRQVIAFSRLSDVQEMMILTSEDAKQIAQQTWLEGDSERRRS